MKNKYESAMRFYLLATQLKYAIRSGWNDKHWNVDEKLRERTGSHIYGTCILAISLASEFELDIDLDKVLKMLILHEIGEVIIGDITPADGIPPEEKMRIEHEAIVKVVGDLASKDEIISLLFEFDDKKTPEAKFAYCCDKFDAVAQAKVYEDIGAMPKLLNENGDISISQEKNNVILNISKIRDMVENGANTVFDIWYMSNKENFSDDDVFAQMLEFLKSIDTNKFTKENLK